MTGDNLWLLVSIYSLSFVFVADACETTNHYESHPGNCNVMINTCSSYHHFKIHWDATAQLTTGESATSSGLKSQTGAVEHSVQNLFRTLHGCNCETFEMNQYGCAYQIKICFNFNKAEQDVSSHHPQYEVWATYPIATDDSVSGYYCCDYDKSESIQNAIKNLIAKKACVTTKNPTNSPTNAPNNPTNYPTNLPTTEPTYVPTNMPSNNPTQLPSNYPTALPTNAPSQVPTLDPTVSPTIAPSSTPTDAPTNIPTRVPTNEPTSHATYTLTNIPVSDDDPTATFASSPTHGPTYASSEHTITVVSVFEMSSSIVSNIFQTSQHLPNMPHKSDGSGTTKALDSGVLLVIIGCALLCSVVCVIYILRKRKQNAHKDKFNLLMSKEIQITNVTMLCDNDAFRCGYKDNY